MMGDLITVFVKSPSIPVQGVLGDYIDRCIMIYRYTRSTSLVLYTQALQEEKEGPQWYTLRAHVLASP